MKKTEVFKCGVCGNMVEVLYVGGGTLTCCGQPMTQMTENTVDAATEKHIPVKTEQNGTVKVVVGSVPHPMEETHYIRWIEVITATEVLRKMLNPGDPPEAEIHTDEEVLKVREYCNLHGLWSTT
jgi:superoxide reductase